MQSKIERLLGDPRLLHLVLKKWNTLAFIYSSIFNI
jgi:hypothetical protein